MSQLVEPTYKKKKKAFIKQAWNECFCSLFLYSGWMAGIYNSTEVNDCVFNQPASQLVLAFNAKSIRVFFFSFFFLLNIVLLFVYFSFIFYFCFLAINESILKKKKEKRKQSKPSTIQNEKLILCWIILTWDWLHFVPQVISCRKSIYSFNHVVC